MSRKLVLFILISSLLVTPALANSYTDVTVSEAKTMVDSNPSLVVLDVRTQSEYDNGHIRNAKLIPHTELEGRLDELNITGEILVYCRSGVRSNITSQILVDNGFMYVYNMLGGITAWIDKGYPVYVKYSSIQETINNADEGDKIFVSSGTYYEHVIVNNTVSLIGENSDTTIIDGNKTGVVILVTTDGTTIKEFTVKNGDTGIYLDRSDDSRVMENNVIHNVDAIFVRLSNNCTIYHNLAGNNTHRGILVTNSWNFTVSNNYVYGNGWYGINANASVNGLIAQNYVYENDYDGIGLLNSSSCTIARNSVSKNVLFGIWLDSSDDNFIYQNSFINNGFRQAVTVLSTSRWDDGVEGNYWSNYTGVDLDHNGIGDSLHVIDANDTDNHPLMGMFHSFNTAYDYQVTIISNSSISDFDFSLIGPYQAELTFNVTGDIGTHGFCRVRISKALINGSYVVRFNGEVITYPQVRELPCSNETYEYLYVNYTHSERIIEISGITMIPEFPSIIIMPLFMIATLLAVIVYKRKYSM